MPDEEKTEDPTPKRRQEAREEGQVATSRELSSAFTLLLGFVALYFVMSNLIRKTTDFFTKVFTQYIHMQLTIRNFHTLLMEVIVLIVQIVAPVMIAVVVIGVLINYLQIGFLFTFKVLQPSFDQLNPINGLKQIFSKKTLVELVKSILKIAVVGYISYLTIVGMLPKLVLLIMSEVREAIVLLGKNIYALSMKISALLIVVGIIDLFYQRWEHEQNLKMSKKEVEEERKQTEGNPQIKSERRERQQQMAQQRMMQEVPEADVVITNPTHIAVALQFEMETMEAPVVIAKGQDEIAEKIKEIAKEHEIEVVEEKQVARALYGLVDIGEQIPEELYQAVAEILAYVYELDNGRGV